jgi:hypothetical protein
MKHRLTLFFLLLIFSLFSISLNAHDEPALNKDGSYVGWQLCLRGIDREF